MSIRKLDEAFAKWSAHGGPLVLATVFATEGSTYSKAGAQMLISGDGQFQGMLSGGCLEGDLAERAATVIATGIPQAVTYDLGQNDEELWGLGVGCDGLMRIFLQLLQVETQYEPFASMTRAFSGYSDQRAVIVTESPFTELAAGSSLVTVADDIAWTNIDTRFLQTIKSSEAWSGSDSCHETVRIDNQDISLLFARLRPPPSVLVLGAGLDAEPVVRFADELGWRVTISDHRPAYVEAGDFAAAEEVSCAPPAELANNIRLDRFAAAIVMSHHLASDRTYLEALAASDISYIGLLGPPDRRRRLLEDLGDAAEKLEGRIHGPAGIDIGARGPAPIALSIIAEMHQFLARQ
jgi:xanthine/CO dehydrogenase XdhC/CoxF family maturation factor